TSRRSYSLLASCSAQRVDRSDGCVETGVISVPRRRTSLLHEIRLLTLNRCKTLDARPSPRDGVINAPATRKLLWFRDVSTLGRLFCLPLRTAQFDGGGLY